MYRPLTQMRRPRLLPLTCPKSHGRRGRDGIPSPGSTPRLFPYITLPCPDPVPGTGPRGKAHSLFALRSQGPGGAQANWWVPDLGVERSPERFLGGGSSLPRPPSPQEGTHPGQGWLHLSLDPPTLYSTEHRTETPNGAEPRKGAPRKPPMPLTFSIMALGQAYC